MSAPVGRVVYSQPHLWVQGELSHKLHQRIQSLDIRADESGMSSLEAVFDNWGSSPPDRDGYQLFDGPLGLGRSLRVAFGIDDRLEDSRTVFIGVITAIDGLFDGRCAARLRVRAEDALWTLRLGRHTRAFQQVTDAAIARRVGEGKSLPVQAEVPGPTHQQLLSVNQSDLALLRERARAVDAALAVDHEALHLVPRGPSDEEPVPISGIQVDRLEISADLAHQRDEVHVHGWSVANKEGIHVRAGDEALGGERRGGTTGAEALAKIGVSAPEHHTLEFPASRAEAEALAGAMMRHRARRFVVARGTMDGNPLLKVGTALEVVDVGSWYTGRYTVVSMRHSYHASEGFKTHFVATSPTLGGGL